MVLWDHLRPLQAMVGRTAWATLGLLVEGNRQKVRGFHILLSRQKNANHTLLFSSERQVACHGEREREREKVYVKKPWGHMCVVLKHRFGCVDLWSAVEGLVYAWYIIRIFRLWRWLCCSLKGNC